MRGALTGGEVLRAAGAVDEGLGLPRRRAHRRPRRGARPGARMLARATRDRVVDGDVVLGPNRDAVQASPVDASGHAAVVLVSGGLGLISLPLERKRPAHARARSRGCTRGWSSARRASRDRVRDGALGRATAPLVIGAGGRRRLADDRVEGEDPLARSTRRRPITCAARRVPSLSGHPRQQHLRRRGNEVAPFEEFMGSHGGLGGWQIDRSPWSQPTGASPRVRSSGVRAMHDALRGWLAETGLELRPHSRL